MAISWLLMAINGGVRDLQGSLVVFFQSMILNIPTFPNLSWKRSPSCRNYQLQFQGRRRIKFRRTLPASSLNWGGCGACDHCLALRSVFGPERTSPRTWYGKVGMSFRTKEDATMKVMRKSRNTNEWLILVFYQCLLMHACSCDWFIDLTMNEWINQLVNGWMDGWMTN